MMFHLGIKKTIRLSLLTLLAVCLGAGCSAGTALASAEITGPPAGSAGQTESEKALAGSEVYGPQFQKPQTVPGASVTPEPTVRPKQDSDGMGASVTPEPTVWPKQDSYEANPSVTPEPTITPIVRGQQTSQEAGTISKPDHPDTVTNDKLILIGDSRTEGIRDAVSDVATDTVFSCLSGMGYDWMVSTGVPAVEDQIEKNTAVVFLMGVNDPYNLENYITYISQKAYDWAAIGAQTYYAAVGPVESDPYITNEQIESFNDSMENSLSGVKFIDVYMHLTENGYSTTDGLHYTSNVSIDIYNYIVENLEEVRTGIWG